MGTWFRTPEPLPTGPRRRPCRKWMRYQDPVTDSAATICGVRVRATRERGAGNGRRRLDAVEPEGAEDEREKKYPHR